MSLARGKGIRHRTQTTVPEDVEREFERRNEDIYLRLGEHNVAVLDCVPIDVFVLHTLHALLFQMRLSRFLLNSFSAVAALIFAHFPVMLNRLAVFSRLLLPLAAEVGVHAVDDELADLHRGVRRRRYGRRHEGRPAAPAGRVDAVSFEDRVRAGSTHQHGTAGQVHWVGRDEFARPAAKILDGLSP